MATTSGAHSYASRLYPSVASCLLGVARIVAVLWMTGSGTALGQVRDSLRHYDLDEIVVRGESEGRNTATIQRLGVAEIARVNAESVDAIVRLIPGAHVPTNSRGETLVYLRNAGERQVAMFLAGALLNVPWDNRVDLSSVPSSVIGAVETSKGPTSILYGTNVLGGAVNLIPRTLDHSGHSSELTAAVGSESSRQVALTHLARLGPWQFGGSAEHTRRDGFSIPDDAEAPFSQDDDRTRTNTDRSFTSLYGNLSRSIGQTSQAGITVVHNSGKKGIAPESHVNPDESSVRYWRYPSLSRTYLIGNFSSTATGGRLQVSTWLSDFAQEIDEYADATYAAKTARQRDDDRAVGARASYSHELGSKSGILLAANYLYSTHGQVNEVVSPEERAEASYRQDIFSFGTELSHRPFEGTVATAAIAVDGYVAPGADADARDGATRLSGSLGVNQRLSPRVQARAAAGHKVRFPTTRELLDTGLGRFILNPDLKPESSWLAEAAIRYSGSSASAEIIPFLNYTSATIDQTRVTVDGESKRQRINLEGSMVVGFEFLSAVRPHARVSIDFNATLMHARGRQDGSTIRLTERPAALATLRVSGRTRGGLAAHIMAHHMGRAWGQTDAGGLAPLRRSTTFDLRISYLISSSRSGVVADVFARADNVLDAVVVPQLGLPAPGRTLRAGFSLSR